MTNYVLSILLIIFWYYLLDPVTNLWKKNPSEEICTCATGAKSFLRNTHSHNWFMSATSQLENFYYYK